MSSLERRNSPRLPVHRPVKLRCERAAGRYLTGQTRNVSQGGALVHVDSPVPLHPGQLLQVGLPVTDSPALLRKDELIQATVVRCDRQGNQQMVAVQFASPQTFLPAA